MLFRSKRSVLDLEGRARPVAGVLLEEDMRDARFDEKARDVEEEMSFTLDGFLVP